jgi:hypothetical protein
MPVAAQQDMGMRPVLAQNMQHSLHDHGILDTRRALDLGAARKSPRFLTQPRTPAVAGSNSAHGDDCKR